MEIFLRTGLPYTFVDLFGIGNSLFTAMKESFGKSTTTIIIIILSMDLFFARKNKNRSINVVYSDFFFFLIFTLTSQINNLCI